ncbi:ABC transporter ATP-binding protein [Bosea sp. (in: a-proteobacteria)]|uniref:ABC transporter ATP-binding protein n=1 Tax=Bosea sp. (in: a-proteobacteria) TaxID=1871050 RepID=UPI002FC7388D
MTKDKSMSAGAMPVQEKLVVEGLTKRYGDFTALHPTDLTVRAGEFMTLLGPSGSGKTTLLMMVAGLLQPDEGRLAIDGRNATYAPPWERGIGMVFQNYALFPHLSVFENIAFPLRMRRTGEAEIKAAVGRALDVVRLPHVADRLPRALSGGQQQRIALARCLVFEPSLILMDEPLGALDKKLRDQLQLEIKHLHRQIGTTILYVTHDQQEALTMSDRVCLMNGGRIEQLGAPQELYFRPRSHFAADFLGESNFIEATVARRSGEALELACAGQERLVRAQAGASEAAGAKVRLMIRPESLSVTLQAPATGNALSGTLLETLFVGGTTRQYIALDGLGTVFCLELTAPAGRQLKPGEKVFAGWAEERGVVLAADAGAQP